MVLIPNPQEILKQLQENPHDEQLQEEFHRLMESDPVLFQQVLELMDHPVEVPQDVDEDDLTSEEKSEEQMLDQEPLRTRGGDQNFKTKKKWCNWLDTAKVQPMRYYTPKTLQDIKFIIQEAESLGAKVKAFGSGHGLSDIAMTRDYLVDTSQLQRVLPIDQLQLNKEHQEKALFNVEAGIKIKRLNRKLKEKNLALPNMGGSDVQSIIGAVSTSTHGSGIKLGPLPSIVRSLVLVSTGGKIYRIEPTNGISDPNTFDKGPFEIELIQNDDYFNSVVVSMGCMGIIYSVVIEVMPAYMLTETRKIYKWSKLKPMLQEGNHDLIKSYRHFELMINPHETNGDHTCIVTTREIHASIKSLRRKQRNRDFLPSLISRLKVAPPLFVNYFNLVPKRIPKLIDKALKGLDDEQFANESYKVLNQGSGQLKFIGCATEVGFTMDKYIDAIEKIFALSSRFSSLGRQQLTAPIGVRFVAKSEAYMSMMNEGETCMIEVPTLKGTPGWHDLIKEVQKELTKMGGKPHWGLDCAQVNGNHNQLFKMYPKMPTWLKFYNRFNAKGTFNNTFTDRMGFSQLGGSMPVE